MGDREDRELQRLRELITRHVPDVGQAISYGMPCYTYREKPVVAVVIRKNHIAWYPYSGTVLPEISDLLADYSTTAGTLRFTVDNPLPDDVVTGLLDIRMRQIDETLG